MNIDQAMAKFEEKKQEVINRLLGTEKRFPITPDITTKYTDSNWLSGKPAPMRKVKNALDEASMKFLAKYNAEFHRNNGRIVCKVDETNEPVEEISPYIK